MDQRERHNDSLAALKIAQRGHQAGIWTAIPGIIDSFDPGTMTATVQPAIQMTVRDEQGRTTPGNRPLLLDCPVQFPAGGGCTLTFPVKPGDECLVVFASRCIDAWWQSGGVQGQAEPRMHSISDGFVLLGFRSQPRIIPSVSTSAAQLRSDDGQAFVEINPSSHAINATTPGPLTLTAPTVTINGNLQLNGQMTATGDVKAGAISLDNHTHPDAQGGSTGAPQ
ncbi:Gp138 family membrane-puncturing spike protein [Pseudomonas sp.]|uniref:Gp138 family membrane-puncturing spike protein n=1 Tax=Pseudomonas sp. TaxID=306 RepID=UPI002590FBCB|nr:Gp138 family membrane-puncturing spike protein [Pseudomonas sp.]